VSKRVSRKPTPEGCRHVAWGFSPRNKAPQPTQSPEGAQAARSDPVVAYAPAGLAFETPSKASADTSND